MSTTDLQIGHIDIGSDVPDLLGDYEPVDMAEELWCVKYSRTKYMCSPHLQGWPVTAARNPNVLMQIIVSFKTGTKGEPLAKGSLECIALGGLLRLSDVAVYTTYPHDYRLVKRDAGGR